MSSLTARSGSQLILALPRFGVNRRTIDFNLSIHSSHNNYYSSYSPIEWWQNRQKTKQEEKYKARVLEMAEMKVWTLKHMGEEIADIASSWAAKIPGINQTKEIQMAKQMQTLLGGIMSVVGQDADEERLLKMDQKEKLKAALAGETTVEEINRLVHQFQMTALMHRILRKRKEDGRPIPTTAEGMQSAIQVDGPNMLSKAQKAKIGKDHARKILRRRR
jgi:hypothetical protein